MKSAITHLWSSLRDLATQSPILLALIAVFSCTPFYLEQDWFADIDLWFYGLYFFIVILQSYITRDRKFSIVYTLLSIGISVGLYTIHETYHHIRGIELATENISYLWLYSMIAIFYIPWRILHRRNHQSPETDWYYHCYINTVQCRHNHDSMVFLHHSKQTIYL